MVGHLTLARCSVAPVGPSAPNSFKGALIVPANGASKSW
jgi:hypothetical protein